MANINFKLIVHYEWTFYQAFFRYETLQIIAIFPFLRWMFCHRECCLFCKNTSITACDDEIDKRFKHISEVQK